MVIHPTVIHLVATSSAPLLHLLTHALPSPGSVRWWTSVPTIAALRAGDLLVIDLLDGGRLLDTAAVTRVLTKARAVLLTGSNPVAPDWLELSRHERVRVVRCPDCSSAQRFTKLVAAIEVELGEPGGAEIATRVLEREPRFAALAGVVAAICERPWETRRPGPLAELAGTSLPALKRTLGDLGFRRVEHFIVAVRLIAFEDLVSRRRLPSPRARRLVGLIDPSNVSRQLHRAQVGSPKAFHDLAVSRA